MALDLLLKSDSLSFFLSLALVGVGTIAVLIQGTKMYRKFLFFQSLPGLSDYSILHGNSHLYPKTPEKLIQFGITLMKKFNMKFDRFWLGPTTPVISIYHPDLVKKVVLSSAPKSRGFGGFYEMAKPWVGEGLIITNGERWSRSRRLLTPAFHFEILKDYMQIYNEGADNLFKKLDKLAETGESFDLYPLITMCTLEIILKCSLGYEANVQHKGHPYAKAISELADIWAARTRNPWLWPDTIFYLTADGKKFKKHCDYVHKLAEDVIEKRKQNLEKGVSQSKRKRLDFIDILLTAKDEDGIAMTSLEMRNEVDTFMFAGHDTTASAIPWCLYNLAKHHEYQSRSQEEIDEILDGRDSEEILWEDLSNLQTLSLCGKESMRLFPPIPLIQRKLNEELDLDGHRIPANTIVSIVIHALHRNPLVWEEPDEFRPERFLAENKKNLNSFAFLPFSAGARNCIGQNFALNEEKVVLSRILRRYNVKLAPDHDEPTRNAAAILRAEKGIWLTVEKRKL